MKDQKDDFIVSDAITDLEQAFPLKDLLALDFFSRYRDGYYRFFTCSSNCLFCFSSLAILSDVSRAGVTRSIPTTIDSAIFIW